MVPWPLEKHRLAKLKLTVRIRPALFQPCIYFARKQCDKESYNKAFNRLLREFSNKFCKEDGSIDWEKLVEFNSGD